MGPSLQAFSSQAIPVFFAGILTRGFVIHLLQRGSLSWECINKSTVISHEMFLDSSQACNVHTLLEIISALNSWGVVCELWLFFLMGSSGCAITVKGTGRSTHIPINTRAQCGENIVCGYPVSLYTQKQVLWGRLTFSLLVALLYFIVMTVKCFSQKTSFHRQTCPDACSLWTGRCSVRQKGIVCFSGTSLSRSLPHPRCKYIY